MSQSPQEVIAELYSAIQLLVELYPVRDGEPGPDMHIEAEAHEKARAAMVQAELFNRDFYRRKARSSVERFYPGFETSENLPRATMVEASTGDYVRYDSYAEERNIVNRIWEMLGNPAYGFLDGRSIYDVIQDGLDAIQLLGRYREGHKQPSGQECYVNIEQGDYRCPDCVEADRITGIQRKLNEMSAARISRLRESLAKSNNGL